MKAMKTIEFIPMGFIEGNIKPIVINEFYVMGRRLVTCEYGFMIGTFDYLTGGKVCDVNITKFKPMSHKEYAACSKNQALATIETNHNFLTVLNSLPIINNYNCIHI